MDKKSLGTVSPVPANPSNNNSNNTTNNINAITVKSKNDPEALLNDLSGSLKSFQSTVRLWTQASTLPTTISAPSDVNNTLRPARLGLGAKVQKNLQGDSVAGNLALKKQLTGLSDKSNKPSFGKYGDNKNKQKQPMSNKQNITSIKKKKKRDFSDDESGGRASLIKKSRK